VTSAESRRLLSLGGFVAISDMMAVLMGLLDCVRQNVSDMRARQAIQNRFNELVDARAKVVPESDQTNLIQRGDA
jgi:hypothetical protein